MSLDKCIADILEDEVDEKYYLSEEMQNKFKITDRFKALIPQATKKGYIEMDLPGVCDLSYPNSKTRRGRVQENGKVSPTLTAARQDICYIEPKLDFVGGIGDKDWVGDNKKLSRNYPQGNRVYNSKGIACSQTSNGGGLGGSTGLYLTNYRIRKLTPRECFRLMGMRDDDIDKIQAAGISNTQKYNMAQNSIVVNVLEAIFKNLFMEG